MPIFEYQCKRCYSQFELLIRGEGDRKKAACPDCGSKRLEKQFSVFGMSGTESRGGSSSCASCSSRNCGSCKSRS
jgi:putative FmdB family regulatory protein